MTMIIKKLAAVAAGTVIATSALAQSAKDIRGPTPLVGFPNEAPAKLIVDPPFPEQLAFGRVMKGDPFERQARGSGNLAASFERNPLRRKET